MEKSIEISEQLYEASLNVTGVSEFGTSFGEMVSGSIAPPIYGAQFDITFEGPVNGEKLNGTLKGVDYFKVRPDGSMELDLHGVVTLDGGGQLAFSGSGSAQLDVEKGQLSFVESIQLFSSDPNMSWVNELHCWGKGRVNIATQKISVKVYIP